MGLLWGKIKRMFRHILSSWYAKWMEYSYSYPIKQRLVRLGPVSEGDVVLDLGCGSGKSTCWTKEMFEVVKVVGLDSSSAKVGKARRLARRKGLPLTFIAFSGYTLPFPSAHFDFVLACFPGKPAKAAQLQTTLEELHRILTPPGQLLFATGGVAGKAPGDCRGPKPCFLDELLRQTGFLYREEIGQLPTPCGNIVLHRAGKSLAVQRTPPSHLTPNPER